MMIDYAILGLLSWKPLTGYDVKRVMQDSPFLYWSGNNNQIYKALTKLLENGFVTNQVQYQESAPNKKIYSITESGMDALIRWVMSEEPEAPEVKKTFLIQLSWAGRLEPEKVSRLLDRYENVMTQQLAMRREEKRREKNFPNRSEQEHFVWEMLYDNFVVMCEAELRWIQQFREGLEHFRRENEHEFQKDRT